MKRFRSIPILFWIGFSLLVALLSYRLGLGRLRNPGPGLMPFIVGIFLLIVSSYVMIRSLIQEAAKNNDVHEEGEEQRHHRRFGRISLVLASLFGWALLLEKLGYVIVTFLFFILLFWSMGNRWTSIMVASVLTVAATYVVFTFFGVKFPAGILALR